MLMLGQGTAADGLPMIGSLWAKPAEGGHCGVVRASLFVCDDVSDSANLPARRSEPGADGWCHYRGAFPARNAAMCMWIDSKLAAGELALVDGASLTPANGTVPLSGAQASTSMGSRADLERLSRALAIVRRGRRFGRRASVSSPER
jgi:hypothetical protein